MSSVSLVSICDLLENDQGTPTRFWIPAYQRGYRWKRLQVSQLLDDIWEFIQNNQGGPFYCLQPLVIKRCDREDDDYDYEVVDGQQRLTTIHILLNCLRTQLDALEKKPFNIRYETRVGSESFLANIDLNQAEENIDYFHVCEAYDSIVQWFERRDSKHKLRFLQHLLNDDDQPNVRVIWFELTNSDDPVDAFTRLNIGKIPLTNDELIRALFLKRSDVGAIDIEHQKVNIATEWDRFESTLRDDQFWYLLNNLSQVGDNRISLLFELVLTSNQPNAIDSDPYSLFYAYDQHLQDGNRLDEWKEIRQVFLTLQEWYNDKRLYHIIGFLVHQGRSIREILALSQRTKKSEFDKKLVGLVYREVFGTDVLTLDKTKLKEHIDERISIVQYSGSSIPRNRIRSILIAFNLITLIENSDASARFPFDKFKKENWDIEHVRSVASESPNRYQARVEWLKHCLNYLCSAKVEEELQDRINDFIRFSVTEAADEVFEQLYDDIRKYFDEFDRTEESDNCLGNLVLLDRKTNRGYKNAVFAVKRSCILSLDETGIFVPLCTRNVFLKSYSHNASQVMFWNESDERDYQKKISDSLYSFFSKSMD